MAGELPPRMRSWPAATYCRSTWRTCVSNRFSVEGPVSYVDTSANTASPSMACRPSAMPGSIDRSHCRPAAMRDSSSAWTRASHTDFIRPFNHPSAGTGTASVSPCPTSTQTPASRSRRANPPGIRLPIEETAETLRILNPEASINGRVEKRIAAFADLAARFGTAQREGTRD